MNGMSLLLASIHIVSCSLMQTTRITITVTSLRIIAGGNIALASQPLPSALISNSVLRESMISYSTAAVWAVIAK